MEMNEVRVRLRRMAWSAALAGKKAVADELFALSDAVGKPAPDMAERMTEDRPEVHKVKTIGKIPVPDAIDLAASTGSDIHVNVPANPQEEWDAKGQSTFIPLLGGEPAPLVRKMHIDLASLVGDRSAEVTIQYPTVEVTVHYSPPVPPSEEATTPADEDEIEVENQDDDAIDPTGGTLLDALIAERRRRLEAEDNLKESLADNAELRDSRDRLLADIDIQHANHATACRANTDLREKIAALSDANVSLQGVNKAAAEKAATLDRLAALLVEYFRLDPSRPGSRFAAYKDIRAILGQLKG